jgi:hypothetical protein
VSSQPNKSGWFHRAPKPDKAMSFVSQILKAHQDYVDGAKGTLKYAYRAGELLVLAQETVKADNGAKNGKWEEWRNKYLSSIPQTTASMYMRLWNNKNVIEKQQRVVGNLAADGELSLRAALALIPPSAAAQARAEKAKAARAENKAAAEAAQTAKHKGPTKIEDLLPNLAPDEVFEAVKRCWDRDQIDELCLALAAHLRSLKDAAGQPASDSRTQPEARMEG